MDVSQKSLHLREFCIINALYIFYLAVGFKKYHHSTLNCTVVIYVLAITILKFTEFLKE